MNSRPYRLSRTLPGALLLLLAAATTVVAGWALAPNQPAALAIVLAVAALVAGTILWIVDRHRETRAFHRHVLELAPEAMVVSDADGRIVLANDQAGTLFGYQPLQLLELSLTALWTVEPGQEAGQAHHRDGYGFPVELHARAVTINGILLTTTVVRDLRQQRAAEEKIARLSNLYAALSQANQAIARLHDRDELFQQICRIAIDYGHFSFAWIGLLDPETLEVRPVAHSGPAAAYLEGLRVSAAADCPEGRGAVGRAIRQGSYHVIDDFLAEAETHPWHPRARALGIHSKGAFTLRQAGEAVGVFVLHARHSHYFDPQLVDLCLEMAGDISLALDNLAREQQRQEAEQRVQYLGQFDSLTGLPNPTLLEDRLLQALANAPRKGRQVAVLLLDLDRFKTVNDSLGHPVGDRLIKAVAERLLTCMRSSDTVSRRGGDEFVVVLPDIRSARDAALVAEKVLETLAQPFEIDDYELNITTSIGIGVYPDDGTDMRTLVKNADAAMYHAKQNGRNNFQFFTQEMNALAFDRLMMENSLRRAIQRQEFTLHYQPQVDTETSRLIGAEALIRWEHPELGMVAPYEFIPIAEENGLITPIGEWALFEACRQNRRWQDQGMPRVPVAVNMSAIQFRKQDIRDTVAAVLRDTGIDPRYLELELTEGSVMSDADEAIELLQELKAMGLQLSIDDFGTGYSSLSYLKRFPLHKLKIDRSFVKDITTNRDDAAITRAIIGMAHSLRLKVIAEGTETRDQLAYLRSQRCDEIQGYYFSRPLPARDFGNLLARGGDMRPRVH